MLGPEASGSLASMRARTSAARPPGGVTLADVARHVGVSARTVSRVVNDEGGCTAETRDRILDAIAELGYRPNLMARGLIRRRSDTIGLVTAEMLDPFFPEFADGVQAAAASIGRTIFLMSTDSDRVRQHRALTSLLGHGVDGVIVFPAGDSHDDLVRFAGDGLPIVVLNDEIEAPGIAVVTAEIEHGATLAIDHLVHRGRTRVAMLIDPRARAPERPSRREFGYRSSIEKAGLPVDPDLLVGVDNSIAGGRAGAEALLALERRPDAMFAYNDVIAIGALQHFVTHGVAVPDDIAVVGFDDIAMCEAVTPRLTSVRIDRELLGRTAVEALQFLANANGAAVEPRRLSVELIVRESS
jgi:LacI family transcriptional regulator